jgi:RND family efflux transporter MFP subunit
MPEPRRFLTRRIAGPLALTAAVAGLALLAASRSTTRAESTAPATPPRVRVALARSQDVPREATFTGRVEAIHRVELRSRVSGALERVLFREGEHVTAGTALFQLDARPFTNALLRARADVSALAARVARARDEFARAERLVASDAVSAEELERRRSELASLAAQHDGARAAEADAALQLEWATVTAPVSGVIGRAEVTSGNLVTGGPGDGTRLALLHSMDPVYVYFDLDPGTAHHAASTPRSAWRAIVTPFEGGAPAEGRIDFIDNVIGPQTGTRTVRARIPNPAGRFPPGSAVRVTFRHGTLERATVIPEIAIGSDQGARYVLIATSDGTVEHRPVSLGARSGGWRVVLGDSVKPGEQIVLPGMPGLRAGLTVSAEPEVMP